MNILEFVIPPLVGALIGYLTNYIAIKMLFKPNNPKYIAKLKIPLTPGIIPKHRNEFALSIASLVSNKLLTAKTIKDKIASPKFLDTLTSIIQSKTESLLNYNIKTIISLIPKNLETTFNKVLSNIKHILKQKYKTFIHSQRFESLISSLLSNVVETLSNKKLSDIISDHNINYIIDDFINPLIIKELDSKNANTFIKDKIKDIANSNKELNTIIPDPLVNVLKTKITQNLPNIINKAEQAVFELKLDIQLFNILREMILDYVQNSSVFIQFFSSVLLIEDFIDESLYPLIREFIYKGFESLREDEKKAEIAFKIDEQINEILTTKINEIGFNKESVLNDITTHILNYIKNESVLKGLSGFIKSSLKSIKENKINDILGVSTKELFKEKLTNTIINALREDNTFNMTTLKANEAIDNFIYHKEIGPLKDIFNINYETNSKISKTLANRLISLTEQNIEGMLSQLNIKSLIKDKINAFPLERVEDIMLMIVKRHLRWINIFGALLGATIGTLQVIYMILRKMYS